MRITRAALAVMGASALLVGSLAGTALADTNVPIYGGHSNITTTAKSLPAITEAGIIMWAADGATSVYKTKQGEARQQFSFDIVTPSNLMLEDDEVTNKVGSITGGKVAHIGAIQFLNTNKGKLVKVGDFSVNFNTMKVYAKSLNGDPIDPLAVFSLVPIDPPLYPAYDDETTPTEATVSGVNVFMTGKGANALNDALSTRFFDGGFKFGKVLSVADLVEPTK